MWLMVYSGLQVIEKFRPLEDISYIDSGTIMATVPAGYRPGTYNLHVTNPDGGYAVLRMPLPLRKVANLSRIRPIQRSFSE